MQKLLFSLLLACVFWTACKKTEVVSGFNDPVFTVAFQTDTLSADTITAGIGNVYLFTRYTESDGLFRSFNTFADVNCPAGDCPGSLSFEFRERVSNDSAFFIGIFKYSPPDTVDQNAILYTSIFDWGDIFQNFTTHTFTLLEGSNHFTVITPGIGSATFLELKDTIQTVSLESTGPNGLQGSILRTVLPSDLHAFPAVSIKATTIDSNHYSLRAYSDWSASSTIQQYQWSTGQTTDSILVDSLASFQEYFVTVTDDHDNTAVASLSGLPFPAQKEIWNAQLSMQTIPVNITQLTGSVAIQWVDAAGVIWRSDRKLQLPDFFFQVSYAEPYEPNENGDPTIKLYVSFQCLLYNVDGASLPFIGNGVIAMARP